MAKESLIEDDNETTDPNKSASSDVKRRAVHFSHANSRYYNTILGDNPSCSSGPPIGLGWDYKPECDEVRDIGDESSDESDNQCNGPCPLISRDKREEVLRSLGYSQAEVAASVRAVLKAKRQRRRCYHNSTDWSRLENIEKAVWEKIKKGTTRRKRQRPGLLSGKERRDTDPLCRVSHQRNKGELDCDRRNFDRYLQVVLDDDNHDGGCKGEKEATDTADNDSSVSKDDTSVPELLLSDDDSTPGSSANESTCITDSTETGTKATTNQRGVHFSDARIRYYDTILGDHPCCSGGPPVSLGWKYQPEDDVVIPIGHINDNNIIQKHCDPINYEHDDDDEVIGESFQMCHCPTLSRSQRENMLHELGYSKSDIAKAVRSLYRAKRRRRQTYNNLYIMRAEEGVEGLTKSMAGLLLQSKKMYDISAYIEELSVAAGSLLQSTSGSSNDKESQDDDASKPSTSASEDGQSDCATSQESSLRYSDGSIEIIANAEAQQGSQANEPLKLSSEKSREKRPPVRFGNVNIRHYDIEVGDNPGASTAGAVLTIGWDYKEEESIDVDSYEESQGPKRYKSRDEMRIGRKERENILLDCGFTMSELLKASSSVRDAKAQRRATVANISNTFAEEKIEVMSGAVKRMIGLRKSGARQIDELWVQAQRRQT